MFRRSFIPKVLCSELFPPNPLVAGVVELALVEDPLKSSEHRTFGIKDLRNIPVQNILFWDRAPSRVPN